MTHLVRLNRNRFARPLLQITATITATLLVSSCGILPSEPIYERAPTVAAYTQSPFEYATVHRGDIEIRESVRLEYQPTQEATLSFSTGGLLYAGIYVKKGTQVQAGQVLAELESDDVSQQIFNADISIAQSELEIKQLKERQQHERQALDTDLKHQAADATTRQSRIAELNERHTEALKDLEDRLYIRQLEREQMQLLADERRLVAPFDATVSYAREVKDGYRSIADESVVRIVVSESSMFMGPTTIPEYFVPGEQMIVTVSGDEMLVEVVDNSEQLENREDYFNVYLKLVAENVVLETGARADASILLDSSRDTLLMDEDALHFAEDKPFVYVESADGLREVRYIEIGLQTRKLVEVLSGLEEGERVIVD